MKCYACFLYRLGIGQVEQYLKFLSFLVYLENTKMKNSEKVLSPNVQKTLG